jgi:hypothetical protein
MSWRCCGNRWRRVSYEYNLQSVINLCDFVSLANRLLTQSRSGGVHEPPIPTVTVATPTV